MRQQSAVSRLRSRLASAGSFGDLGGAGGLAPQPATAGEDDGALDRAVLAAALHEVRSIAAGIAGAGELIRDPEVSAAHRDRMAALVVAEARRLERRAAAHGVGDECSCRAVTAVPLREPVTTLAATHRARGMRLTLDPALLTLDVAVPADDVAEMLGVLLDNAARHAPGSAVHLTARRHGPDVFVRVSDDGPGIAQAQVRVHSLRRAGRGTPTPSRHGHGIGLASARTLAARAGGHLYLVRTSRRGTTWELQVPAARPAPTTPTHPGRSGRPVGDEHPADHHRGHHHDHRYENDDTCDNDERVLPQHAEERWEATHCG
ncbi:sensor histidine kinase [Nocardioides sp. BSK12Z-4]|uniref:histidine kinase n=1 Tax=Nocardioides bruguierae TaxID=2945102 RepID=A0A9X2IFQ3_9ACTN|nr:sensor histidine kinase [Nocardioides bruguierae]